MNACAWAIDHFDVYLRGRRFVLYTDHKPLETMKTIHQKTMNRLQERMNMYDFQTVYKKGSEMPADILSRQPLQVSAVHTALSSYQKAVQNDPFCVSVAKYLLNGELPADPTLQNLIAKVGPHLYTEGEVYKLRNGEDDGVIILPKDLVNAAIDNAHGTLLTGHGGIDKTVARIRQLYYWPSIIVDVKQRLLECERCQKALKSQPFKEKLHPLPLCTLPNQRIHCDLFGPLKTKTGGKAHVLCITDAATKWAEITMVPNKEAGTIANAILLRWICRYGIPSQIFTDGGKEFCNKILNDICTFLNIAKNKTTPAHPQCNAQVEIVNKTIKKYLATMTEDALDWKSLIPTLQFQYNSTVNLTTGKTPFQLMFGYSPNYTINTNVPVTNHVPTDGILRHLFLDRQLGVENNLKNSEKYRVRHDNQLKPVLPQAKITAGNLVFLDRRMFLNTNEKIEDKWEGPYMVYKVFSNGTLDLIRKGRVIRVNKNRCKPFVAMGSEFKSTYIPEPHILAKPKVITDKKYPVTSQPTETQEVYIDTPQEPTTPGQTTPTTENLTPPNNIDSQRRPRGRPRKSNLGETQATPNDQTTPTETPAETPTEVPTQETPTTTSRYGTHPMVLRQRGDKPTVSHLKIASLTTSKSNHYHKTSPKIEAINKRLIKDFALNVNIIADSFILDQYALPKKVKLFLMLSNVTDEGNF